MKIKNKTIAVIGLGYVGLPLAVEFGKKYEEINEKLNVDMPITQAVYNILYDKKSAKKQIKILTNRLN